jgi:hypothetical protein
MYIRTKRDRNYKKLFKKHNIKTAFHTSDILEKHLRVYVPNNPLQIRGTKYWNATIAQDVTYNKQDDSLQDITGTVRPSKTTKRCPVAQTEHILNTGHSYESLDNA